MYISKIKTRFRSDSDAAVLGSLGFATTLWQLSQLTKCRRLHTVLILLIYTAGLFFTGQLLRPAFGKVGRERYFHLLCRKTPGSLEAGCLCSVVSNRTETPALDFARESPKATNLTKS